MIRFSIIIIILLGLLTGCKQKQSIKEKRKQLVKGRLDDHNTYSVDEIGWSVSLPQKGWEVVTRSEQKMQTERAKEIMEEALGMQFGASKATYLVSIRKDPFNSFTSSIEAFEGGEDAYDKRYAAVTELLKRAYTARNIDAIYELGAVRIDGIPFDRFIVRLPSPDKKTTLLTQKIYSYHINGYDLIMVVLYSNKEDEETLTRIIHSSKFSLPKEDATGQ